MHTHIKLWLWSFFTCESTHTLGLTETSLSLSDSYIHALEPKAPEARTQELELQLYTARLW